MANHKSAEKRIRRNLRRRAVNGVWRARLRTYVKTVEEAIANGDREAAKVALVATEPQLARGAQGGHCTGTLCGGNCRVCRPESGRCNPQYLKFGRRADLYKGEI